MAIDWLTALAQADQSLEGTLARRDVGKMQQMLAGLAQEVESRRQFGEEMNLKRQALSEQTALRIEQQRMREQLQQEAIAERARDNERSLYSNLTSGRRPGDRVGKQALDLIGKMEGGTGDYSADPQNADQYIYKQAEAARLLAEAEQEKALRESQEKRAQRDQQLQEKADQRADRNEQRQIAAGDRAQKRLDMAIQKANEQIKAMPVHLRPAIKERYEQLTKEGFLSSLNPWDEEQNKADAWLQAVREVQEQAVRAGQMAPGPTATLLPDQTKNQTSKETPEQRRNRLLNEIK